MVSHRFQILFLLLLAMVHSVTYCQTNSSQLSLASPTSSNFVYPQSIFVDSPNGHIWVTDFDNNRVMRFDVSTLTSVENARTLTAPGNFFLSQNFPNPFNPVTQISFSLNASMHASLTVYNLLGQKVATLFDRFAVSHTVYSIQFDAKNLPSGIYMYSLRSKQGVQTKRMCLVK